jgi:peptidoglycan/xylan/chitin deacetylase (PgdA/CDA1 family)
LRKHQFVVMDIDELFTRARQRDVPNRAVVFTIDDGYFDQASIGAEIFLQHDCPVTIFLATGLTDGTFWPLEAQIAYAMSEVRKSVPLRVTGGTSVVDPSDPRSLRAAASALVWELKRLPISDATERLAETSEMLGVEIPNVPPDAFAPLTWADARRLEARGVRFGSHTVRHVTLSREPAAVSRSEIHASTVRLRDELSKPSRVFCYPTGRFEDYGNREKSVLADLGYDGAVSAVAGYATTTAISEAPFDVLRFGFPGSLTDFKDIVLQLDRLREHRHRRRSGGLR